MKYSWRQLSSLFWLFLCTFFITFCGAPSGHHEDLPAEEAAQHDEWMEYASMLSIQSAGECFMVNIHTSSHRQQLPFRVLLCPPEHLPESSPHPVIVFPVQTIALTTTTQAGMLNMAGGIKKTSAVLQADYFYHPSIREGVQNGSILDIHIGDGINWEMMASHKPDVMLLSSFEAGNNLATAYRLGLTAIPMAEHLEHHPLGRAEWVVLAGLLNGTFQETRDSFRLIARQYHDLAEKSDHINGPTVLTNMGFRGTWYVPGNENYMARLIRDAGGRYLWHDLQGTESRAMDLEQVLSRASGAEVWINTGRICSISEILDADPRYSLIKALQQQRVYAATARVANRGNAFDFYESGVVNPHILLADLISIFHHHAENPLVFYEACR